MIRTKLEIKYFGRSAEGKMLTPKLGCERQNDQGNLCALGLKWQTGLGMAKADGGLFERRKQWGESVRVSAETQKRGPQAASAGVSSGNLRTGDFLHKKAWSPVFQSWTLLLPMVKFTMIRQLVGNTCFSHLADLSCFHPFPLPAMHFPLTVLLLAWEAKGNKD